MFTTKWVQALVAIVLILSGAICKSQSISVTNIVQSAFPIVTADILAFDELGNQVVPLASEVSILENGKPCQILNIACTPFQQPSPISIVISIDNSVSMASGKPTLTASPLDIAKQFAKQLSNQLLMPPSAVALQVCSSTPEVVLEYSANKPQILRAIEEIRIAGSNNFFNQLASSPFGALQYAAQGSQKRIAVLLTDSRAAELNQFELQECKRIFLENKIQLYTVAITDSVSDVDGISRSLRVLSESSGGMYFTNVTTLDAASIVATKIQQISQGAQPCKLQWRGGYSCSAGNVKLEVSWKNSKVSREFIPSNRAIVGLQSIPNFVSFGKIAGGSKDTVLLLKADNIDMVISDIVFTHGEDIVQVMNPNFPITIKANTTVPVQIRCTPKNNRLTFASYEVRSNVCVTTFSISCGDPASANTKPTLLLTTPNGGEQIGIGGTAFIEWDGIAASDVLIIDVSRDNGNSWETITNSATNNMFVWNDIPGQSSDSCLVKVYQLTTGNSGASGDFRSVTKHTDAVNASCWRFDGKQFVTVSSDGLLVLWNSQDLQEIRTITTRIGGLWSVGWSPDGTKIACGGNNGTIQVYDASNGRLLQTHKSQNEKITGISWSSGSDSLAAGSTDGTILIISIAENTIANVLVGHTDAVSSVSWNPRNMLVASTSSDGYVAVWNSKTGARIHKMSGHSSYSLCARWSKDGSKLISSGLDGTLRFWDFVNGTQIKAVNVKMNGWSLDWNADGSEIAIGGNWGGITIVQTSNENVSRTLTGHSGYVSSVQFSPTAEELLSSAQDKTARIWRLTEYILQKDSSDACFSIQAPNTDLQAVDMRSCIVGATRDSVVNNSLVNSGKVSVLIKSVRITGVNASDFSVVSGLPPFSIAPGESHQFEFRFQPTNIGTRSATIEVITQNDTLRKPIVGTGTTSPIRKINTRIDFGDVHVGATKDTVSCLTIQNIGSTSVIISSAELKGVNASSFTINSSGQNIIIPSGDTLKMDLRFTARSIGPASAIIQFFDLKGEQLAEIALLANGIEAPVDTSKIIRISSIIDFGDVQLGDTKDSLQCLTIKNIFSTPIIISQVSLSGGNSIDFRIVSPNTSFILQPGETNKLDLRFTPQSLGVSTCSMLFESPDTDSTTRITVVGNGINKTIPSADTVFTTIVAKNIECTIGDTFNLCLFLEQQQNMNMNGAPRRFTAAMRINSTIMFMQSVPECLSSNNLLCDFVQPGVKNTSDSIMVLPGIATLGSTDSASIEILNFSWTDSSLPTVVRLQNGTIKLLGVCEEGGKRLYIPGSNPQSLTASPNPARMTTNLEFCLIEETPVYIDVVNVAGNVICTPLQQTTKMAGTYTVEVNTHPLPAGVYCIRMITPLSASVTRLDIVK